MSFTKLNLCTTNFGPPESNDLAVKVKLDGKKIKIHLKLSQHNNTHRQPPRRVTTRWVQQYVVGESPQVSKTKNRLYKSRNEQQWYGRENDSTKKNLPEIVFWFKSRGSPPRIINVIAAEVYTCAFLHSKPQHSARHNHLCVSGTSSYKKNLKECLSSLSTFFYLAGSAELISLFYLTSHSNFGSLICSPFRDMWVCGWCLFLAPLLVVVGWSYKLQANFCA